MDPVLGARILLRSPGYLGQDFKSEFLCKALRDQVLGINGSYDKCPVYQLALQAIISAFPLVHLHRQYVLDRNGIQQNFIT